jgi:hypothetical protein
MMRRLIRISATLAIVLGGAYACAHEVFKVTVTETVLTEAISPDGEWKALEYERFYDGPFPFLTDIIAVVRLIATHDPVRSADILSVSAHGADEDPSIAWAAPRTLQVDVPGSMFLKVLTCEFGGVRIDIRVPPEDAANRTAFYHEYHETDPDPGGELAKKCP